MSNIELVANIANLFFKIYILFHLLFYSTFLHTELIRHFTFRPFYNSPIYLYAGFIFIQINQKGIASSIISLL